MIISKRGIRALCLCLVMIFLVSCSGEEGTYPFEELLRADDAATDKITRYDLIVSTACSEKLRNAADAFGADLTRATGVPAEVIYDQETISNDTNGALEILLGKVDRPGVASVMKNLRKDDYICQMVQGCLLIGGIHEDATVSALDRFCREILPAATASCLMHPDGGFSYSSVYPQAKVSFNGFELTEYTILYSESLYALAKTLQTKIAAQSGYWLDLAEERSYKGVGKELVLCLRAGSSLACVTPKENGAILSADTLFGVSVAVREFCEMLFSSSLEDAYDCRLSAMHAVPYRLPSYRIATVLATHLYPFGSPSDVTKVVAPIQKEKADAVLFGSMNGRDAQYISDSLTDYTVIGVPASVACCQTISLTLCETKTDLLTVAVFRTGSGDDGMILVHVSGTLSEPYSLVLPEWLEQSELPVVVIAQVLTEGVSLSALDVAFRDLSVMSYQTYDTAGCSYAVCCYGNANAVQITAGTMQTSGGYAEFQIERTSVFSS